MASGVTDEDSLSLDEFVKLPTTVDFQVINTDRFKAFVKDKPYIHLGTELANNYIVGYGKSTEEAVKVFQQVFNLPVTGEVNFPTWYAISDIYVAVSKLAQA